MGALYQDIAPEVIRDFTAKCLHSYYIDRPHLASPAFEALQYARTLQPVFPRAALVFAVAAIEVTTKDVLLKPTVFGLVHNQKLAEFIAKLTQTTPEAWSHLPI